MCERAGKEGTGIPRSDLFAREGSGRKVVDAGGEAVLGEVVVHAEKVLHLWTKGESRGRTKGAREAEEDSGEGEVKYDREEEEEEEEEEEGEVKYDREEEEEEDRI